MILRGVFVGSLFLGGMAAVCAQEQQTTAQGVFTVEQAKRGAAAYAANCATCHGGDLRSTDREVPNLTERPFQRGWVGKTVAEKFEVTRDTMPPREERSLPDQVYLDIVTYIMQFNKVRPGDTELKPAPEILKRIVIAAP